MGVLKNIRHEYFVRQYIRCGGNGAEAYRRTMSKYPWKEMRNLDYARTVACTILARPDVRQRYEELRTQMAKRADITEDKILTDYQEALNMARHLGKPEALIAAAREQAKLVGLLRERIEHGDVGDFENMDNVSDILAAVRDRAGAEAALALAKAFGLGNADTANVEPSNEEATGLIDQSPPSDSVN